MNKKVLVIGSTGQLGTDMCTEAEKAGYDICGIDFPEIDIADKESVDHHVAGSGASLVVNCAAYTAVDDCETHEKEAFSLNAEGAGFIAAAAAKAGARVVHISTDYVFSGSKKEPYTEDDMPDPKSAYGRSKLAGERKVAAENENHQIFRIAWLYGQYGRNFVFTIRNAAKKKAAENGKLFVVNDQVGTPTSTREVCRQVMKAQQSACTGVFHATCEGFCSWYDFTRKIVAAAGIPVTVMPCSTKDFPRPAPRPANSRLENGRLKKAGIAIMKPWEEAFEAFLREEAFQRSGNSV